ncbi:MAG: VanZ family protein [Saprospiraceae bacterium]
MASLLLKTYRQQWLPALAWAVLLLLLSGWPSDRLPKIDWRNDLFGVDKAAHFVFYALFAILLSFPLRKSGVKYPGWMAFSIALIYGMLMEMMQYAFFPGRQLDVGDMLANGLGAGGGVALYFTGYRLMNGRSNT